MKHEILHPHFKFFLEKHLERNGFGNRVGAVPQKCTIAFMGSDGSSDYYFHLENDVIHRVDKMFILNRGGNLGVEYQHYQMNINDIQEQMIASPIFKEKSGWVGALIEAEKFLCLK